MHPHSLFSLAEHLERLSKDGDPLVRRPLFNPMRPHIATLGLGRKVTRITP